MARTRPISKDITMMPMIHPTGAPTESSSAPGVAGAEGEGRGVVLEVGDGEIVRVVFGMSLV